MYAPENQNSNERESAAQMCGERPTLKALKEGAKAEYVNKTDLGEEYFPAYYNGVLGSIVSLLLGGEPESAIRLAKHYCDKANKEQ